jgi:hypothetical protein
MNEETQNLRRPRVTVIEVIVSLVIIYTLAIRLTVLASLVALVVLYIFLPLYHSRRVLAVAAIVLVLAVLIPIDVYVRGFHGPIMHSKHDGLRLVPVVYGLGARPIDGGEAVSGGCVVRPHDTRWVLIWD